MKEVKEASCRGFGACPELVEWGVPQNPYTPPRLGEPEGVDEEY
jgi:hypothetical protein